MEEQEKRPIGGKRLAPEDRGSFWSNWGYLIVTAAVIVVLFKVIFQLSWVPSGSMETTIPEHTLLISWQLPYMVSDPTPERGDIVTFWSDELNKLLVKRVVGLPGDDIAFRDGYTYVNGEMLDEAYLPRQALPSPTPASRCRKAASFSWATTAPAPTTPGSGTNLIFPWTTSGPG